MSTQELIKCSRCGKEIEADSTDPGTYYHEKCYRIEYLDPNYVRTTVLRIYADAKVRLDRQRLNKETDRTENI